MLIIIKGKEKRIRKRNSASLSEWLDKYQEHRETGTDEANQAFREAELSLTPRDFRKANERKTADIVDDSRNRREKVEKMTIKKWHRKDNKESENSR